MRKLLTALAAALISLTLATPAPAATVVPVRGLGYVQGIGWTPKADGDLVGAYGVIGTTGQSRELQAYLTFGADLLISAKVYGQGWTEPSPYGVSVVGKRIVGIQVTSTDPKYRAVVDCHVQDVGWVHVGDGQKCGAPGSVKRLEAVRVRLITNG